jgi:ketosteroid isomerase-like protein
MANAAEVVQQYRQAFQAGDTAKARSLLADDLHFKGPFEEFHKADDYLQATAKLASIVRGVDLHKVIAHGSDVVTLYDLHTTVAGTSSIAEWATVENGKIVAIRAYFDARPFAAMFEQR